MANAIRKCAASILKSGVDRNAVNRLSSEFWIEFVKMSHRLGAKPEDMARVIMSESAFDPAATAIRGGKVVARGLNQLTEVTLPVIGMTTTQWNSMSSMSAIEQLKFIEKYYRAAGSYHGVNGWNSATQLYVANFAPAHLSKSDDPHAVLYKQYKTDGTLNPAYTMNAGLDRKNEQGQRRGYITVGDLTKSVLVDVPDVVKQAIKTAESSLGLGQKLVDEPVGELEQELAKSDPTKSANVPEQAYDPGPVDNLIGTLLASDGKLTKIVKKSILSEKLPTSKVLIRVNGAEYHNNLEYARVAASLLRRVIDAEAVVCGDGDEIEIQSSAIGSEMVLTNAVSELCDLVVKEINKHIQFKVSVTVLSGLMSIYGAIEDSVIIKNNRRFNQGRIYYG